VPTAGPARGQGDFEPLGEGSKLSTSRVQPVRHVGWHTSGRGGIAAAAGRRRGGSSLGGFGALAQALTSSGSSSKARIDRVALGDGRDIGAGDAGRFIALGRRGAAGAVQQLDGVVRAQALQAPGLQASQAESSSERSMKDPHVDVASRRRANSVISSCAMAWMA
jgi:hypothetical protein